MSYNKRRVKQLETIVSTADNPKNEQFYQSISQLAFPIRLILQVALIASCAYVLVLFGGV